VLGDTTRGEVGAVPSTFETVTVAVCPAASRMVMGTFVRQAPVGLTSKLPPLVVTVSRVRVSPEEELRIV
jgi:hypothetical protein